MSKSARSNRLLFLFLLLFAAMFTGQIITGFHVCNLAIAANQGKPFLLSEYLHSGHFLETTFENWQGECLLLSILVFLPVSMLAETHEQLINKKRSFIFFLFFFFFFGLHFYGSLINYNNNQILEGKPVETVINYISNDVFWFECFQNWQSIFLCLFFLVLSDKLRSGLRM